MPRDLNSDAATHYEQAQQPGAVPVGGTPASTAPMMKIGAQLMANGALSARDLMRALALQTQHRAQLGDILRAHGMVSDAALVQGLADQFGTSMITARDGPPDPRLIDQLGGARCLALGCVPWRRAGGVTLIATARPDRFDQARDTLQAVFGPLAMAVIAEDELHRALLTCRRSALRLLAESCVPHALSCRVWNGRRFNTLVLAGLATLTLGLVMATGPLLALLFGIVLIALLGGTALKLAAIIVQMRQGTATVALDRQSPLEPISVMVPMYNEPDIAPRLIKRLGALRYPRELLDILLVVEEDDWATRDALAASGLPCWMRVIPVPESSLRTKPRALNYALSFARGSIIGVYDAEDAPDPDQLTLVSQRFAAAPGHVACLQGRLDYYNPATNWLSRCFTVEYNVWFRLILPGLEKLGLVVPLGGTTLFFRRTVLEGLGGWDAHNVTEDADLGIRLARQGYVTELIPTTTQEEANCRLLPWIKQRSRWLKGYAMTYAVHMREPRALWRQLGPWRFAGVQLLFLGTLIQFFLAPLLWSFWLVLFGFDHPIAAQFPAGLMIAVMGLFIASELIGWFAAWRALDRPSHRWLRVWALTQSLYFPLAAFAAYKALWEMLTSPFYWDKTAHGLHDTDGPAPGSSSGAWSGGGR